MKFGEQFEANIADEWKQYYVEYNNVKKLIARLFPKREKAHGEHDEACRDDYIINYQADDVFDRTTDFGAEEDPIRTVDDRGKEVMDELLKELDKVDNWYKVVEPQLVGSFDALKATMQHTSGPLISGSKEAQNLKENFLHLLRREMQLVNYVALNIVAFEKLLKNFQKRSGLDVKEAFMREVNTRDFASSHLVDERLIPATYALYAQYFEGGNMENAQVNLQSKVSEITYGRRDAYFFGVKCGIVAVLSFWMFLHLVDPLPADKLPSPPPSTPPPDPIGWLSPDSETTVVVPVFRACGMLILLIWSWGLLVQLWSRYRISWVFAFEFNSRTRLTYFQIYNEAANLSIFYLILALGLVSHHELFIGRHAVWKLVYPLSLITFIFLKLVVPFSPFRYWVSRYTLLECLYNVVKAPFGRLRFRDIFCAEMLTSMSRIFVDLEFVLCVYISDAIAVVLGNPYGKQCRGSSAWLVPLFCALPMWFRLWQCFRLAREFPAERKLHTVNFFKHLLGITVVVMGAFHHSMNHLFTSGHPYRLLWAGLCVLTALSFFLWDVVVDWGLFRFAGNSAHPLLRPTLLYHKSLYYYIAIVIDFVLRFNWVLTIIPLPFKSVPALRILPRTTMLPILIILELFRRFVWSLFTVEHEHMRNSQRFRAGNYAPALFDANNSVQKDKQNAARQTATGYGALVEFALLLVVVIVADILGRLFA